MTWARDDAKLDRVRALMGEHELDALVVRAPDNVLYLTNFWGMKGYDACVFPREGEPVLLCLEASADDAERSAWTSDVRFVRGYVDDDPRPVPARTLEAALAAAKDYGRVGLELSLGTQASDRMVGEPTTFTKAWFDAWPQAHDAAPVLNAARAIKSPQEVERIRLANEICAAAMEHVRGELRPGMKESQAAAIWQGFVHGEGTGWQGKVELALAVLAGLVGVWDQNLHGDGRPAGGSRRADAVRDLGLRRRLLGRPHQAPGPRASCARTTASSRLACWRCTSARSRIAAQARASLSSTGSYAKA